MTRLFERPTGVIKTWDDAAASFLRERSPGTAKAYRSTLVRTGDRLGRPDLSELNPENLYEAFREVWATVTDEVRRQRLSGLRSFIAHCVERGWLEPVAVDLPDQQVRVRAYKRQKAAEYRDPNYVPKRLLPAKCSEFDCDQVPLPGRAICREHRNAQARDEARFRALGSVKSCLRDGCEQPRHRWRSQESAYCHQHYLEIQSDYRKASPSRGPRRDRRICAREGCEQEFEWTSAQPRQRFCTTECRVADRNDERRRMLPTLNHPVSVDEKRCCTCKQILPASEFHRDRRQPDGLAPRCRTDATLVQAQTHARNPRSVQKQGVTKRLKRYNIVIAAQRIAGYAGEDPAEAYDAIFDQQNGICPWCQKPGARQTEPFRLSGTDRAPVFNDVLVIDHNHDCCGTGGSCGACVRCLMHRGCNLQYQANSKELEQRLTRMRQIEERYDSGIPEEGDLT